MSSVCLESSVSTHSYDNLIAITRTFNLNGFDDELDAVAALILDADCPTAIGALYRHTIDTQWVMDEADGTVDFKATVIWDGKPPASVDAEFISGAIQLRPGIQTTSYAFLSAWKSNGVTTDNIANPAWVGRGIVLNGGAGIDSDVRLLGFQIRRIYPKGTIDVPLIQGLHFGYINKPNSATWRGFGIGTVKITNIDFNDEDPGTDQITWQFACAETSVNLNIAGHVIPLVYGWNHVEPIYTSGKDPVTQKWNTTLCDYVEVHQLLPFADLNDVI